MGPRQRVQGQEEREKAGKSQGWIKINSVWSNEEGPLPSRFEEYLVV
jgi:hypothetical protein